MARITLSFSGWLAALVFLVGSGLSAMAQDPPLAQDLEALKQDVLTLNRELLILEEELLYPASSQIEVYLSVDVGDYFALDGVRLMINGQMVGSELYTEQQVQALHRGGVQRLYRGNLPGGTHEVSAFFTGLGPQGQDYKRAASIEIEKHQAPVVLELRIVDSSARLQPVFEIKQWPL
ncbi:AraC family transcriptional regulator [Marinimicrobium alkaliphilum]|uniref:AraC family transcriptional regulator n=1 Tax=Marinimicrobium alkaliphilum TaxID=2202654 RepID=UPI000DB9B8BD|nr:AraC family transcriptional regulator [Marinimicrobium alkaliphilum]